MLLEVKNLSIEFVTEGGIVRVVDKVSFQIDVGKTLGIVGESGCGKSVTALSLMRLLPKNKVRIPEGEILFEGNDLLKLSEDAMRSIRGNRIGMIFQEPMTSLNPVYTAGFQIAEAIQIHRPDLSSSQVKDRAISLLTKVGISEPERRFHSYPHEMSGGMRQRVMIAMALSCEPKLLIADEPTTALDVTIQAQILELVQDLQKDLGMAVILITHDLGVVAGSADDVMVMYAGKVAERTDVQTLFRKPMHPYTTGLMASLPRARVEGGRGRRTERLTGIPGSVPNFTMLPLGCRFQDRCRLVKPRCREAEPLLEEKDPNHLVSCFEV